MCPSALGRNTDLPPVFTVVVRWIFTGKQAAFRLSWFTPYQDNCNAEGIQISKVYHGYNAYIFFYNPSVMTHSTGFFIIN